MFWVICDQCGMKMEMAICGDVVGELKGDGARFSRALVELPPGWGALLTTDRNMPDSLTGASFAEGFGEEDENERPCIFFDRAGDPVAIILDQAYLCSDKCRDDYRTVLLEDARNAGHDLDVGRDEEG
jgi:hypothetical protein